MKFKNIGIIGSGTIGAGWGALALRRGLNVTVFDPEPGADARIETAERNLVDVLGDSGDRGSLSICDTLEAAVAEADFVQESGPENLEQKRQLFQEISRVTGEETVIATSSSGLSVTEIQEGCHRPGRCIIGHPFNPPYLIPLVEVVVGKQTSESTANAALNFYRALGKKPIRLRSEVPGYIANRLQNALFKEAVYLIETGAASVEDIDNAIAWGPGIRWAIMGPFLTFALGGGAGGMVEYLDKFDDEIRQSWQSLGEPALTESTKQRIIGGVDEILNGSTLKKTVAERDRSIAAILATLRL